MIRKIVNKMIASFTAVVILITSLPFTASAEAKIVKAFTFDNTALAITQATFGDGIKAEMPKENTFEKRLYDSSKNIIKSIGLSEGASKTAEILAKTGYLIKQKAASAVNYIGKWGMNTFEKFIQNPPRTKFRKGHMTLKYSRYKNAKGWYDKFKGMADYKPKPGKFGKRLGGAVDVGIGLYGFYTMWDEPNIGYKSPFLEFAGNSLRGMANAGTLLGGIIPQAKGLGEILTVSDLIINSPLVVDGINKLAPTMGFLDDWTNIMNQSMQDIYTNAEDWINYWVYGIEGDENEKLLAEMKKKCKGQTFQGNGVGVYKPNIYLYPDEEVDVSVTFGQPNLLTVSDPPYENGWYITAHPNGKLETQINEYKYLFYESVTYPELYQTYEGYLIPANDRRKAFTDILKNYGLNDREIDDFCEFWCEKLNKDKNYAMYPQLTDTIDITMPVNVSPEPESKFRIWFAFAEDEVPKYESKPTLFKRNGFTMVEWGGFIID